MPKVNPEILVWARETAGLSEEEASVKIGLKEVYGLQPSERLALYESGKEQPRRALLVKMAEKYHRPLLTFYLSTPPLKGDRGADYRRLPDTHKASENALIDTLVRKMCARQNMVKDALMDSDEASKLSFIGTSSLEAGVSQTVEQLQSLFDFSLDEFRRQRDEKKAFNYLRKQTEKKGIFVVLVGNLGSHHTNLSPEIFRGFALADNIAPFIFINDKDSKRAWSFTLLHELVHLLIGESGISGTRGEGRIEKFCNDVASEFLFPEVEARALFESHNLDTLEYEGLEAIISSYADERNLSKSMMAYKLFRTEFISKPVWMRINSNFREYWRKAQEQKRQENNKSGRGPSYYIFQKDRLGASLVSFVDRMMSAGILTTTKSGAILGVKPQKVHNLFGSGN